MKKKSNKKSNYLTKSNMDLSQQREREKERERERERESYQAFLWLFYSYEKYDFM